MAHPQRQSEFVGENGAAIETYVDGEGPAFVILPSYGRDSGADDDRFTARWSRRAGWSCGRSRAASPVRRGR